MPQADALGAALQKFERLKDGKRQLEAILSLEARYPNGDAPAAAAIQEGLAWFDSEIAACQAEADARPPCA